MKNFDQLCQAWNNEHVLDVQIKDHIDELKAKDTYMKMHDIPKGDNEYRRAFDKECMDLYLLLAVKYAAPAGQARLEDRIQNILGKIAYARKSN